MSYLERILERANAEGRTRVRCAHCSQVIELEPTGDGDSRWITDDGQSWCPGPFGSYEPGIPHQPENPAA